MIKPVNCCCHLAYFHPVNLEALHVSGLLRVSASSTERNTEDYASYLVRLDTVNWSAIELVLWLSVSNPKNATKGISKCFACNLAGLSPVFCEFDMQVSPIIKEINCSYAYNYADSLDSNSIQQLVQIVSNYKISKETTCSILVTVITAWYFFN